MKIDKDGYLVGDSGHLKSCPFDSGLYCRVQCALFELLDVKASTTPGVKNSTGPHVALRCAGSYFTQPVDTVEYIAAQRSRNS